MITLGKLTATLMPDGHYLVCYPVSWHYPAGDPVPNGDRLCIRLREDQVNRFISHWAKEGRIEHG